MEGTARAVVPLPGRTADLTALAAVVDAQLAGRGPTAFLHAPAGLGKTTLLDELVARVRPTTVLQARGHPREADLPLGLARQLLDHVGRRVDTAGRPPPAARALVLEAVHDAVVERAGDGPVLVLVDDLHWADEDSLGMVGYLAARLGRTPVALVGALRPWPEAASQLVDELVGRGLAHRLVLEPLDRADAGRLLRGRYGRALPSAAHDEIWAAAGGNPLLLTCAADHLCRDRGTSLATRPAALLPLPAILPGLPDDAVRCARAAAVLGPVFRPSMIAAVSGLDEERAAVGVDILFRAGVLRADGEDGASFVHPLVADAIDADHGPRSRAGHHRRAFRVFARLGEVELAAGHALAADMVGEPDAIAAAEEAGDRSLRAGAPHTAITHLRGALALAGATRPGIHLRLGDALAAAGQPADAAASYRAAVEAADLDDARRGQAMQSLSRALAYAGDLDAAARATDRAIEQARRTGRPPVTAVVVDRVHVVWQTAGPAAAMAELETRPGAVPSTRPGTAAERDLAATQAYVRFIAASDPAALGVLAALYDASPDDDTLDSLQSPFTPVLTLAAVSRYTDDLDRDARLLDRGRALARTHGLVHLGLAMEMSRVDHLLRRGRPDQVLDHLQRVAGDVEVEPLLREVVVLGRASALVELGRPDEAVEAVTGHQGPLLMWQSRLAAQALLATCHAASGDMAAASEAFLHTEQLARDLGVETPSVTPWASAAVEAHLAVGAVDDVTRVVGWLDRAAERLPGTWHRMTAAWGRAGIAGAEGDHDGADRCYADALAVDTVLPLERARVLVSAGSWYRRTGRARLARPLLAEAVELYERGGARRRGAWAEQELRVAGGRRRTSPRAPDDLTPQERRVAVLAADGRTTREISELLVLSPKTIETHLTHVYRKLGVHSKRELRRLGLFPPT